MLAPADRLQRFDVALILGSVCESFELDQILYRRYANFRGGQGRGEGGGRGGRGGRVKASCEEACNAGAFRHG